MSYLSDLRARIREMLDEQKLQIFARVTVSRAHSAKKTLSFFHLSFTTETVTSQLP